MALQRPYNINLKGISIDATESNVVTWQVSGDIQESYKVDIYNNADGLLVYTSNQVTSYALKHTIPAATLTNGIEYKIEVTSFNELGTGVTSYPVIFSTSSRPIVTVTDIGTVGSFSYTFSAIYGQMEDIGMSSYVVNLYNESQTLISTSGIKTGEPLEHMFDNLQSDKTYYIEFQATSAKGLTGSSGKVSFFVSYYQPKLNINLHANNIENAGIQLSWFVTQIILENNGGTFINNEKIDVRNGFVSGDEGFDIAGNFSMKVWIEEPKSRVDLVRLIGENGEITLQYHWIDEKFHLYKKINNITTEWVSDAVSGNSFLIGIQQIEKDMNIVAQVIA